MSVALTTIVPLLILISSGFISKKLNILKKGDERVLSAYVYYFALPSLFIVIISEVKFTKEILTFILAGILPVVISIFIYTAIYIIFRIKRESFYLISLSTIFGSLAFFGIPFIIFALPESEKIATLQAAVVSVFSVSIAITMFEFYSQKGNFSKCFLKVGKKLSKNPLIISIIIGLFFSILKIPIPEVIKKPLNMLGQSTAVVAIFMLGAFLYGRKYKNFKLAFGLSLLRMFFLPLLAFFISHLLSLNKMETNVNVLMHAMPMAVSMIILSERYKFYEEIISSVILISSVGSIIYLNIWLFLLGF